ncbi:Biotin/lipoate A/B protein ligase family protein [Streptomyces sp. ADI92-24]|nr:hypothetical protein [Streptomyces sp. ADI92-24]MCX4768707.1 hypothetical protein [Streptomyces sp. NBC_01285]ROQ77160.1 AhpD family alkylhydroperoxidase [Streptomyces sp. CEV 2-1]RPK40403.1 Biotin/lipoate A/B protein ligase family protein [Streptomyces sp. ADI92-24]
MEPGNTITHSLSVPDSLVSGLSFADSYAYLDDWVLEALGDMGIKAWYQPLNDIATDVGKIAGAAQKRVVGRDGGPGAVLHHVTMSYDIDADEVVAAGVSLANRCPFCVDAHTVLLHATGDHRLAETIARGGQPEDPARRQLLYWGKDMSTAQPFPSADAPEIIGTALSFHFINRIVSALLTESMLPCGLQKLRAVRSAAGRRLARTVRQELTTGLSLPVRESVAAWDGVTPLPLHAVLPDRAERPGARLALLAARAPYRITDEDVAAWLVPPFTDHCLAHLIAYGAGCAVGRVEATLTTQTKELA